MTFLILPVIIVLIGFGYFIYDVSTSDGWFAGIGGFFGLLASGLIAVSLIIGHFI